MGSVTYDSREQWPWHEWGADSQRLLEYEGPDGEKFSYDFEVVDESGRVWKVERKAWPDYVQSFTKGTLDRQCSAVDILVIEDDPLALFDGGDLAQHEGNAAKHMRTLRHNLIVEQTEDKQDTMAYLRWLADRKGGMHIRTNQMQVHAPNVMWKMMEALPGFNPHGELSTGEKRGYYLEQYVNWDAIYDAFIAGMDVYNDAIPEGDRRIGSGTKAKLQRALFGEEG